MSSYTTQNSLLLNNLLEFYNTNNNLETMLILSTENRVYPFELWLARNKLATKVHSYHLEDGRDLKFTQIINWNYGHIKNDSTFCRWERINIPYKEKVISNNISQLNFFKWALENDVIKYIRGITLKLRMIWTIAIAHRNVELLTHQVLLLVKRHGKNAKNCPLKKYQKTVSIESSLIDIVRV